MRNVPYSLQAVIFVPLFAGLVFVLKAFCPDSAGDSCFADYFATPIFLPLIAIYKILGGAPASVGQELLFILLYWGAVGFLLGFILDLYTRPSQYSPEPRLPPSQTSGPVSPPQSQGPLTSSLPAQYSPESLRGPRQP